MEISFLFCPIYKVTKLYCPGCGITRMILSILKGDLYQAFRYNPLIFILIPLFFILLTNNIFLKNKLINKKNKERIYITLIAILIIYGIIRNIDYFSYLKPTKIR